MVSAYLLGAEVYTFCTLNKIADCVGGAGHRAG